MWINRFAAVLALISAFLHLRMGMQFFVITMSVLCVFCAVDLWRSSELRAWVMMAAASAGMLLAHSPLPSGHRHATNLSHGTSMSAASAVAAVELILAASVVFFRTRNFSHEIHPHRLQELR